MKTLDLKDFIPNAQPPFDMDENDFIDPTTLIGKDIEIRKAMTFENHKGPGVYLQFNFPGEEKLHYTTSHAGGITRIFENADLVALLEEGNTLPAKINRRPSKKDSAKTVWELI